MIEILGAPYDLGGRRLGSRLGPAAIRLAEIEAVLHGLGFQTHDRGDVSLVKPCDKPEGFKGFLCLLGCVRGLNRQTAEILAADNMPLILCGEHTLASGGVSAAFERFGRSLGVLWIDAHADVHTPGSSPSGNIHGMPLAALQSLPSECSGVLSQEWSQLISALGSPTLQPEQIAWYALREVDTAERDRVRQGIAVTMHEIDRFGIEKTVEMLDANWRRRGIEHLWISFDVDALDPMLAPGTGTAVRGGLSYREAHLLAELLREKLDSADCPYTLAGIDIVEVNPLADTGNETAMMAVEWVASLLGKKILG